MTHEEFIWQYLKQQGLTDAGSAGVMGNLYAESGLNSKNLQNSYENKLGYTDETYTQAVDNGTYANFINDGAGYGLAQFTYWTLKRDLLTLAKKQNKSIGDLELQLEFLINQFKTSYKSLYNLLISTSSVGEASNGMLLQFERPADQNISVQNKRITYSENYYNKYSKKGDNTVANSNSSLVTYTNFTNNRTIQASKTINRITIHCIVGQWTAKQGCDYFATSGRQASANYIVGKDGSIGLSVAEKDRSWCSSSADNDKQSITIEVASDTTDPYAVTNQAYDALLDLVTDICKRNGKTKVIWNSNKTEALAYRPASNEVILTVHRWFAAKACPGDYLYNRHGKIANTVTQRLNGTIIQEEEEEMTQEQFNTMINNWITEQANKDPGTWSANERAWAEKNGYVKGDNSNRMMYKKFLTREEMITVLYRFANKIKGSLE